MGLPLPNRVLVLFSGVRRLVELESNRTALEYVKIYPESPQKWSDKAK